MGRDGLMGVESAALCLHAAWSSDEHGGGGVEETPRSMRTVRRTVLHCVWSTNAYGVVPRLPWKENLCVQRPQMFLQRAQRAKQQSRNSVTARIDFQLRLIGHMHRRLCGQAR